MGNLTMLASARGVVTKHYGMKRLLEQIIYLVSYGATTDVTGECMFAIGTTDYC